MLESNAREGITQALERIANALEKKIDVEEITVTKNDDTLIASITSKNVIVADGYSVELINRDCSRFYRQD